MGCECVRMGECHWGHGTSPAWLSRQYNHIHEVLGCPAGASHMTVHMTGHMTQTAFNLRLFHFSLVALQQQ